MKYVIVDFSGTLIKPEVAEEANQERFRQLNIPILSESEEKKVHGTKGHYSIIKDYVEKSFGIQDDFKVQQVQNYGERKILSGKDIKTQIMTDLFRNAMYNVASKRKSDIFREGMIESLQKIKDKGYKLAIVSGIREDIITGMLQIAECPIEFEVHGQDSVLSRDDSSFLLKEINGEITYVIGDKLSDLEPAKEFGAKPVFLKGGHPTGGEEDFTSLIAETPSDLEKLIN